MRVNSRVIIIALAVLFVGFVIWAIVYALIPRSHLTLYLAPEQGTLTIDGNANSVSNGQVIEVAPGVHTIIFSRSEFSSQSQTITATNGQTSDFVAVLAPLTDAAKQLLQTPGAQSVIERYTGLQETKYTNTLTNNYPIVNILPINARFYTINTCPSVKYPNDPSKIALCVKVTQNGLEQYVDKDILSRGYNPNDYEIIFNNVNDTTSD